MKKSLLFTVILLLVFSGTNLYAQKHGQARIDSLLQALPKQREDTNKVTLLCEIANGYNSIQSPEIMKYAQKANELALRLNWRYGITRSYNCLGCAYLIAQNNAEARNWFIKGFEGWQKLGVSIYFADLSGMHNMLFVYCLKE